MSQIDMFALFDAPIGPIEEIGEASITNPQLAAEFKKFVAEEFKKGLPGKPDLAGELLQLLLRDGGINIFKLQAKHFDLTGRCHHFCELYDAMEQLDSDGRVTCDFSSGERVWFPISH